LDSSGRVGARRVSPVWRQFFRGSRVWAIATTGREDLLKSVPAPGTYNGVRNIQQSVVKLNPQRFNIGIAASNISFLQLSDTAAIQ
jgi:hypothetical protein